MEKITYVKGLGNVMQSSGDFSANLKDIGRRIISPRDEAYARLATDGKENIGQSTGTWTSAGLEYAKGELPVFNPFSRLLNLKLARQAVEANRAGRYFNTEARAEYDKSLKQAQKKKSALVLPSRDSPSCR